MRFLRLALAAVAVGADVAHEDAAALLQVGAAVGSTPNECECLTWKQVYTTRNWGGVPCGSGQEFRFLGRKGHEGRPLIHKEMCERFFHKFNNNHCIQEWYSGPTREQWCYVPASCPTLDGGSHVKDTWLSWKYCSSQDKRLLDASPERLYQLAQESNVDPGYVGKYAYPVWSTPDKKNTSEQSGKSRWERDAGHIYWPGAQEILGIREKRKGDMSAKIRDFYAIQNQNEPWILDSLDGRLPWAIVEGGRIYEAKNTMWYYQHAGSLNTLLASSKDLTYFECIKGCSADVLSNRTYKMN